MAEMSYVKIFLDWIDATRKLNDAEKGRLIDAIVLYAKGDMDADSRLTGNESFVFPIFQLQIDRDQNELHERSKRNSENGKKGGRPKKEETEKTEGFISVSEKSEKRQDKEKDKDKDKEEDKDKDKDNKFDRWWAVYPKKVGKEAARRSFAKVKVDVDVLIKAVEEQKNSVQWKKYNGRYIPNPATWLNQGRWEDEIEKDTQEPVSTNYGITDLERLRKLSERLGKDA